MTADRGRPTGDLAILLGRTFLIFGGAYFLRAVTESGRIPAAAGVVAGLAYASFWLVAAERSTPARRLSAEFHGVAALVLALPVIWEATARFGLMSSTTAAFGIGGVTAAALTVAAIRRLRPVAHVAAIGAIIAAFAIGWATDRYGAMSMLLIALSTGTYWISEGPRQSGLRWPMAAAAGLSVMVVTARAASSATHESVAVALSLQAFLLASMIGSVAIRTVLFSRNVRLFDVAQGFFSLFIGIGGAAVLTYGWRTRVALVGVAAAILAAGGYLAAFFRLDDRPHLAASHHAFAAFGLTAGVAALHLIFREHALAVAALSLALVTLALGQRRLGGYAALHASVFLLVSVRASDLLTTSMAVWTSQPSPWPSMDLVAIGTLAAAAGSVLLSGRASSGLGGVLAHIGRLVSAVIVVVGSGGAAVVWLAPLVSDDAGTLATLRTVLLSLSVFVLSSASRAAATAVFGELLYPVLILGGVKLAVDDLRHSRPSSLFVALAFYGLAWVIAGRARTAASRNARAAD